MKNLASLAIISLALFALPATPVMADGLFYLSGKIGTTSVNADIEESFDILLEGDDEGGAVGVGFKLGDRLVFELAYHDFGAVTGFGTPCIECLALVAPLEGDTTAISLSFLPHFPITDRFLLFGKIGVISWETSLDEVSDGIEQAFADHSEEDLVYGAGLRYLLPGPFGVFAEFERFADSFETVSLGATLGF
jgi:hypothetical protein